jgi:hypothetical protein
MHDQNMQANSFTVSSQVPRSRGVDSGLHEGEGSATELEGKKNPTNLDSHSMSRLVGNLHFWQKLFFDCGKHHL